MVVKDFNIVDSYRITPSDPGQVSSCVRSLATIPREKYGLELAHLDMQKLLLPYRSRATRTSTTTELASIPREFIRLQMTSRP